jgi:hypothetical protein
VQVALLATLIALVLGTLSSMVLTRYEFFGHDAMSLLVVLPIAPHGGFKESGYGKDLSAYSLEDYTRIKHVMNYTG